MDAIVLIVEHFIETDYNDLTPEVVLATKKSILDTLGCCLAGTVAAASPELVSQVLHWGGREESTIINYGQKVPAPLAALVNGTMARALDFDDVYEPATVHASASIVPVAFAAAELAGGIDGKELLTAVAVGIDVICRMAAANRIPPGVSGMNATFQCAYFACAGVAGRLLGLTKHELIHAMGLAYTQTAGNSQNLLEGTLAVRLNQGLAAHGGMLSAVFAKIGLTAAQEVLEGKFGYYPVYQRGEYDRYKLLHGLRRRYEGVNLTLKLYPCCMHTHAAVDAILRLKAESNLAIDDVTKITVGVNQQAFNFVCFPLDKTQAPQTVSEAQFSLPYAVAVAFTKGTITLDDFTEDAIRNPTILKVARKVECEVDSELETKAGSEVTPAIVSIAKKDGKQLRTRVCKRKGSPMDPLSYEEVAEKFQKCANSAYKHLPQAHVQNLVNCIKQIESLTDVCEIIKLLQP